MLEEMLRGLIVIGLAGSLSFLVIGYVALIVKLADMGHRRLAVILGGCGVITTLLILSYIIGSSVSWCV